MSHLPASAPHAAMLWRGALCALLLVAGPAHAAGIPGQGTWETTLQPRDLNGDGVPDAYYDTSLNITWLANTNLGFVAWKDARAQAKQLSVFGIRGWRLPKLVDTGAPGCDVGNKGTDCGYNVNTKKSELAHMFYVTLGNKGFCDRQGNCPQEGWGLANTGPFDISLSPVPRWWSGLDYFSEALDGAWGFDLQIGQQWVYRKLAGANVWVVHAGDVAPVSR